MIANFMTLFLYLLLPQIYFCESTPQDFSTNGNNFNKSDSNNLLSVIVIYRHGDRTPVSTCPTDPYKNESLWPVGFGQLTNVGKIQQYDLGKWLRYRYSDFLPLNYSQDDIYVRSTDVDRTLMSAYANLAGLYPPTGSETWNPNLLWQPIPVHTMPEKADTVLAMKTPCRKFNSLLETLLQTPYFTNILKESEGLMEYVSQHCGQKIDSLKNLEHVYNTFVIEQRFNFTLPEWTRSVFPDKMKWLAALSFATSCYTQDLARFKTGPLFHQIIGQLKDCWEAMANETRTKRDAFFESDHQSSCKQMFVYSAHDTTVANILNSLQIFEYHSPPFASTVLIELHRDLRNNEPYINIFYKNTTEGARLMKLPKCDVNCPLSTFEKILAPIAVDLENWERECAQVPLIKLIPFSTLQNVIIIGACFLLTLLITSILASIYYSKTSVEHKKYHRLPDTEEYASIET